jgi:hypothetical protein
MQISRSDDEQSTHLKASFKVFEKEINQQIEHINDSSQIHLRSEHRKSSSHLFNHCIVSVHLLCLDLIRFSRRARLQAEKECCIDFYERHSNQNDSNHRKRLQKHRRSDFERRTLSALDTSAIEHDHL